MEIETTQAAAQLDELVTRAQAGEPVVLTIDGRPAARLVVDPAAPATDTPHQQGR